LRTPDSKLAKESKFIVEWRRDGPLSVLLDVVNYIETPQQYAL
jgi:hypothetical protein